MNRVSIRWKSIDMFLQMFNRQNPSVSCSSSIVAAISRLWSHSRTCQVLGPPGVRSPAGAENLDSGLIIS